MKEEEEEEEKMIRLVYISLLFGFYCQRRRAAKLLAKLCN